MFASRIIKHHKEFDYQIDAGVQPNIKVVQILILCSD